MILYLDECYNTGNNWNDENQLFFTYGGWLVSEENLEKAKSIVRLFANNYQGELKSKSFASHKGIKKVINLSKDLISEGNAVPFFMCFEKKFMIACKAVEIFFDHKTNCKVNGYLTFPNEYEYFKIISKKNNIDAKYEDVKHLLPPIKIIKMALAETIYTDEKLCSYIGDVINNKNIEDNCVDNIINQMANLFNEQGLEEIAQIFKSENFSTDEIYEELIGDTLIDNTKVEKSKKSILVQPSIFEMTQNLIDEYKDLELVVDTLGIQNMQFEEISKLLNIPIKVIEESENDSMIMASDLLVGHIARLIKDIVVKDDSLEDSDIELLKNIITNKYSAFEGKSSLWYFKISQKSWNKLSDKLKYKRYINDYNKILKNMFHQFKKGER